MTEPPPPLPDDWNRCRVYMITKKRYCRQVPVKGLVYCGNHLDYCQLVHNNSNENNNHNNIDDEPIGDVKRPRLNENGTNNNDNEINTSMMKVMKKIGKKRIPCPLDPSHTIYESNVKAHVKKCNIVKQSRNNKSKVYYQHEVNKGGFGLMHNNNHTTTLTDDTKEEQYYQNLAIGILRAYVLVFGSIEKSKIETKKVLNMTLDELYRYIPTENYANSEKKSGLEDSLIEHRIKVGSPKHLEQIASIVGHIRDILNDDISKDGNNNNINTIIEMGAGRATTGFVVGSVIASYNKQMNSTINQNENRINKSDVKLILVERAGSRQKADRAIRREQNVTRDHNTQGDYVDKSTSIMSSTSYMNVNGVHLERVKCDLAHVNLSTVLHTSTSPSTAKSPRRSILVIAKHCCGVGTDLALKSLLPIKDQIHSCLFTTCCHGVCSWDDYVGRDYLNKKLLDANREVFHDGFNFGEEEFDLMKRWACGTVIGVDGRKKADERDLEDDHNAEIIEKAGSCKDHYKNITFIVKSLAMKCGPEGFGRACQRLIDYGRQQYMKEQLFSSDIIETRDGLSHYVDANVTPQNALLKCQSNH